MKALLIIHIQCIIIDIKHLHTPYSIPIFTKYAVLRQNNGRERRWFSISQKLLNHTETKIYINIKREETMLRLTMVSFALFYIITSSYCSYYVASMSLIFILLYNIYVNYKE